jgi:3-oxoacyl-[acyl-carrier protein] reductase
LAREIGNGAIAVKADITNDAECNALVQSAVDALGGVDFLVNNAGMTKHVAHEDMDGLSKDDFHEIYDLNVVGAFQMLRAALPYLRKSSAGAVVNVASVAGVFGIGSSVAYAASKGAMITMTKSLARVLAPQVRVNAVAPGYVDSGWFDRIIGAEGVKVLNEKIEAETPMRMAPKPDDISGPVAMLLDPSAKAVTGEVILVDAGAHLDTGLSRRPGKEIV